MYENDDDCSPSNRHDDRGTSNGLISGLDRYVKVVSSSFSLFSSFLHSGTVRYITVPVLAALLP
jgi:hypothetical protein